MRLAIGAYRVAVGFAGVALGLFPASLAFYGFGNGRVVESCLALVAAAAPVGFAVWLLSRSPK